MATYSSILASMIPVFGVMGIGALLRRTGGLNEQSDRSILRMVIHVFTPCLILTSLLGNPATADRAMLLWAPLLGIVTTALSILTCWLLAPLFGLTGPRRQVFAVTTGLCN